MKEGKTNLLKLQLSPTTQAATSMNRLQFNLFVLVHADISTDPEKKTQAERMYVLSGVR